MDSELNSTTSCSDLLANVSKSVDTIYNESVGGVVHFDNADLIPDLIAHNDEIQKRAIDKIDSIKNNSKTDRLKEFLKDYFPNGVSKTQLVEILTSEEWSQVLSMYDLSPYDYSKDSALIQYWADMVNFQYLQCHPEILSSMNISMATEAIDDTTMLTACGSYKSKVVEEQDPIENMKAWISHAPISSYCVSSRTSLSC